MLQPGGAEPTRTRRKRGLQHWTAGCRMKGEWDVPQIRRPGRRRRRVVFGDPTAGLRDESQLLRYLDFHAAAVCAGVSPRRLACDKLVEHLSRQLRDAHAMRLGDRPEPVARVL